MLHPQLHRPRSARCSPIDVVIQQYDPRLCTFVLHYRFLLAADGLGTTLAFSIVF